MSPEERLQLELERHWIEMLAFLIESGMTMDEIVEQWEAMGWRGE